MSPSISHMPSDTPSLAPSSDPTHHPTTSPITSPSLSPSTLPTRLPSSAPSDAPTELPTLAPSPKPSSEPSQKPSPKPSPKPTMSPTISQLPSNYPSPIPSPQPSNQPSHFPSSNPTNYPTFAPTKSPTLSPTVSPSRNPSTPPSDAPSTTPSITPSLSSLPSQEPSISMVPTKSPTQNVVLSVYELTLTTTPHSGPFDDADFDGEEFEKIMKDCLFDEMSLEFPGKYRLSDFDLDIVALTSRRLEVDQGRDQATTTKDFILSGKLVFTHNEVPEQMEIEEVIFNAIEGEDSGTCLVLLHEANDPLLKAVEHVSIKPFESAMPSLDSVVSYDKAPDRGDKNALYISVIAALSACLVAIAVMYLVARRSTRYEDEGEDCVDDFIPPHFISAIQEDGNVEAGNIPGLVKNKSSNAPSFHSDVGVISVSSSPAHEADDKKCEPLPTLEQGGELLEHESIDHSSANNNGIVYVDETLERIRTDSNLLSGSSLGPRQSFAAEVGDSSVSSEDSKFKVKTFNRRGERISKKKKYYVVS
ncbi:hypothetical protein ACHAXS_012726 [Conticribra weissflogii]